MTHRLVGYTMRLKGIGPWPDEYFTASGDWSVWRAVLSAEKTKELWLEYANSGAFFQIPIVTPVYDYRRRC